MPSAQRLPGLGLVVVEGLVESELTEPRDLLRRARAADHAAAPQLRHLADERARPHPRRPRRTGLALLGPADLEQPDPRRQPRHPEHAERGRDRRERGIDVLQAAAVGERQLPPAEPVRDPVPSDRSFRDATTCPTAPPLIASPSWNGGTYDLTSFIRAAHVRVDGDERVADQHLAVGRLRHVTSTSAKSLGCGIPCGRAARWISRLAVIDRTSDTAPIVRIRRWTRSVANCSSPAPTCSTRTSAAACCSSASTVTRARWA